MKIQWLLAVVAAAASVLVVVEAQEPPQYGYDNLPTTRFTCEGKLQGRYYADPETDCQMFHVCVRMSRNEIQDYRFLCPNGTVFDQEHLVCADFYQVACHSHNHGGPFGHIFEFLKLSASKEQDLNLGNIPLTDPDYLGRNTLGGDDFQVEEYNNNKLAAQGNSLYSSQGLAQKDIRFPTTTTRRTTTTTPRPTTTRYTTAAPTTTSTTTADPYYQYYSTDAPLDESYASTSNYQANNLNFHRETDVPQTFPTTTTRRPDYFPGSNFGFNNEYTTSTTYAPPTSTTYNYDNYYQTSDSTTTTRRPPAVFQSTFRTTLDALTTPAPSYQQQQQYQQQQTFQQQPSRFGDDYFRRLPTTEQSTTAKTQYLFYGETSDPSTTPPTTRPPTTTYRSPFQQSYTTTTTNYNTVRTTPAPRYFQTINVVTPVVPRESFDYTTEAPRRTIPVENLYFQSGRSVNGGSFAKSDRTKQFATKATSAPAYYTQPTTTLAPQAPYYDPSQASYSTPQYYEEQRFTETSTPTTTTSTTTETPRPVRRGGRRRLNPNRQRQNNGEGRPVENNSNNQFQYSRRVETNREAYAVQRQRTEEVFNAEASVFRGPTRGNTFYSSETKSSSPAPVEATAAPNRTAVYNFGGENFGRRIRPGGRDYATIERRSSTTAQPYYEASSPAYSAPVEQSQRRVVKRLRAKSTTTTEAPAPEATLPPFVPSSPKPRVNVRTKTIYGPIKPDANFNGRRVIVKKVRPSSTAEPAVETASASAITENNTPASFKVEEVPPPKPVSETKNLTATVGGFKVTVISKSSDQQTSTSIIEEQTTPSYIKPSFPKLNKSFLTTKKNSAVVSTTISPNNANGDEVGSTKSPDYDYQYFNTDDETQYVAEQNSQDRLYGNRARKAQTPAAF